MCKAVCVVCDWEAEEVLGGSICPECKKKTLIGMDSVSEDDYRKQNPIEKVNE